jgi:protocatechuate 3,4-dioxygenase beta subunit
MSLPADSVKGASDEVGNVAFSASFFFVYTQLQVTATSPAVGSILTPPITDLVVQFNKAFNPYTISTSDFQLSQGTVVSAVPLKDNAVDLTLSGITQDGTLTLTIPAGAILDQYGVGNQAFTGTYIVQIPIQPYPVPLVGKDPAGSLIYDPSVKGAINFQGDTDTYTLPLAADANQEISLVLSVDPSLIGTLTLVDPNGNTVATATGGAAGQTVVLNNAPVTIAGTYSLVVGGSGGTLGNYTLQAILNAHYKQGTDSINTIGTAQDLSPAFVGLGTTPYADRAGVLGTISPTAQNDYYAFHLDAGQSASLATAGQNGGQASLGLFDGSGNLLALANGAGIGGPINFGSGFAGASGLTFNGSATINGSNLQLTDGGFSEAASAWSNQQVYVGNFSTSFNFQITPGTNPTADGFTFTIQGNNTGALGGNGGSLGYAGIGNSVAIKFDLYNNQGEGTDSTGIYTDGAYPGVPAIDLSGTGIDLHSGDVFNVAMNYDGTNLNVTITDTSTLASASQSYAINIPSVIGSTGAYVGFTGGTGGLTAVQNIQNWTFTPSQQLISAAKFESINNFVATTSGIYYAQVDGNPGTQYSLVVTRGADFGLHASNFNNAQQLDGTSVVLGAITKGAGALQALDLQAFAYSNIYQTDPVTGAFGSHITSPNNNGFFLFGQNMAFDGTYTYYNDGYGSTGTIYKLDSTGAVVASTTGPNSNLYGGLAYLNGKLYADAPFDSNIYIYDSNTLAFLGTINTGSALAWTGLAGDPDRGVLWGLAQGGAPGAIGTLAEIDPSTGAILKEGPDNNQGSYEQDIAYANGQLIVSEVGGAVGVGALDEYNPDTLGFLTRVFPPYQFDASGLAGDGVGGQATDWYQFNVNAGDNLVITTTTPGGNSGNGQQFINDLNPTINLYDANGNLVATATGNAGDGRNSIINWTALSGGSYRVQIEGATKDSIGEYTLAVQGATGGQYPFHVTSTNPAAGSDINYIPSTMTVTVDNSTLLTSVVPGDLTVDGTPATGVSVVDNHTFSFTLPPLSTGDPATHSVSISGLVDIHGVAITPDNFTFEIDTIPPYIVSSSLANGSVFSPAPQTVTDVITFSEPMITTIDPSSIDLFGEFRNVHYAASSASYDSTGTVLTITYDNLPSDAYQFNLYTFGFHDLAGNQLVSGLTTNFEVLTGTTSITGMTPVMPLGSLVYQETLDSVLPDAKATDTWTLGIDPKQTLGVIVKPITKTMTATVQMYSPAGNLIGTATSPTPGAPAILPAVQSSKGGTYKFVVSGGPGEYKITPTLNALIDQAAYGGPPNNSIATATPIDPYANRFVGQNDRTAVLGALSGGGGSGLFSTDRFSQGLYSVDKTTGASTLIGPLTNFTSFSGMATDPSSGTTYVSDVFDPNNGQWSLATIDLTTGQETIIGPQNDSDVHSIVWDNGTLFGFSIFTGEGTFNLSTGAFTPLFPFNTLPEVIENAAIAPDGTVYGVGQFSGSIYTINLSAGTATFVGNPNTGNFDLIGLAYTGGSLYELGYNGGSTSTPLWQIDPSTAAGTNIGPNGLEAQPDAMTAPPSSGSSGPVENQATYSFALNQGESATMALESLNGKKASFALYDDQGNLLALSYAGATNYTQGLNNFVAPNDGTFYVQVSGDPGLKFNLVVTRGADFTTQPHTTLATAQDVTATQGSGDPKQGGALGYLQNPNGANVGTTIEGIDFNGSNCGCLPPDTNAAVGNGFVAETVNVQFRVWDTAGNQMLDEPLSTLFGAATAGDPYVEYDASAGHWYVTGVDGADNSKIFLAISKDANPTDGFSNVYSVPLAASGDLADFPKFGYNADAIVIEANDFGDGHSVVTAVDKAQAIAGTLVDYQSTPAFNFRALTPAQMHDALSGGPMWFMASTGDPTYDGTTPNTIRITRMDNVLSTNPTYTDYTVSVNTYGPNSGAADQPGAPGSVATNDVTTTSVDYLNGSLVTAFSASTPADGFKATKVHWYQVDVTSGTPSLVQEGLIDPGQGVATFFPSAAQDPAGNIGISYMESSSSEFVSAYVAGHIAGQALGTTTAGVAFAPGQGSMPESFREGDYGTAVYDPGTGEFWAANEYSGPNASSDIWNTKIAAFTLFSGIGTDYYSVNANASDNLHFATSTPAGGPLEFVNNFYPELLLYDPNGNLVAIANGNASDGRNSVIDFTVPSGDAGKWVIEVTASPSTSQPTQGEYGLLVTGATGAVSPFSVVSTIPATGALVQPPTDYIATFSAPILATSLTAGELTINGIPALSVTQVDAFTADWKLDPSYIITGDRVLNTVVISADPGTGQRVMDVSGASLADFTSTFTTDNVAPYVVSSSINNGDVFNSAPYNLTEAVTWSEPMNTAFTTASAFDLYGQYRNQHIAAASFSWDSTGTILTINYTNVPDDVYTLTLFASGFQDLVGLAPTSDFTVNFAVTFGTGAFPTPLTPVPPLGDLIYTGSLDPVLVTPSDVDSVTISLNAGETLTVVGAPTTSTLQLVVTVLDPSNNSIGTATAAAQGSNVTLETVPVATTGSYTIQVSDANGNLGLYGIQLYLNSYLKVGTSNLSIATATDISGSSFVLGPGNADRLAVVGSLPAHVIHNGDAFVAASFLNEILEVNGQGQVTMVIPVPQAATYNSLAGIVLDPIDNMLYAGVTTSLFSSSVSGELVKIDPLTGAIVGTIALPPDPSVLYNNQYYPFGFSVAPDGSFWIAQSNSGNIIHVDSGGNLLDTFSTGNISPDSATINAAGNVYFTGFAPATGGSGLYLLDTTTRTYSLFASEPNAIASDLTSIAASDPSGNGVWVGDFYNGAQRFDQTGAFQQGVGYYGTIQAQTDSNQLSANVWTSNYYYGDLFRTDQYGNYQFGVAAPGAFGLTVWGVDNPNPPPQDTQDYYKFDLTAGQSATIVAKSLNSLGVNITLVDGSGNVLATGIGGSSNVDSKIENYVAGYSGTYYVEVQGDLGVQYSLTVTRAANFDIHPNNTMATAQSLTGTNGVLGALTPGGSLTIGSSFEGIDFNTSNCGCLPPDTNATVGNNYVMETVNEQIRIFDKTTSAVLFDEPLTTFFGQAQFGDVYALYDDIANRWYVSAFDGNLTGLLLAVSKDGNPLDGFLPTYHLSNLADAAADYEKPGFNKDGIFITFNDFNSGGGAATVISIDKAAALTGTLTDYISHPEFQFRGMPPAQMHGDTVGGTEWFFSTDGNDTGGNTMRVTKVTNYLSNNPTFTYTSIPVAPYQSANVANQPGGTWTTFPNTTTYETQYRNGILVTAMASATAADGFTFPKGLYYEVDVTSGTPVLVKQGVIDPGPGVSVQMPSVDIDSRGNLGFTWMEASNTEYVSMWVGSLDNQGHFSSYDAAPGGGFFVYNFRIGDYSTVVLDPTDGTTFWAANEYVGADGSTDIWRTHITSFSVPPAVANDWYKINVAAGNSLDLQTYTPSDQGGQFLNDAAPNIELYDTFGNLVAVGTVLPDGRNEAIFYNAPVTGTYFVHVFNNPGNSGEYFLSVTTASYQAGDITGQVYNDLNGSGTFQPGDPGLQGWEVDVFDSSNTFVASQLTDANGNFDIGGLAPGTYTVSEVPMVGWTQTQPGAPYTYTVTVTAGQTSGGNDFGNFKNITISGEKFNDLTGIGAFLPGDPGLQGWTIDLLNAAGAIVATTVTDANGNYSFTDVGPGTYTVQEVLQSGWIQTFPAPPGTYTFTATSGSDQSGLLFGNFQLVTFAGQVYNDLNGDGSNDGGTDPGLQGWTINLLDPFGNVVATTTSDVNGNYSFANVGPGMYTIQEVNQSGWYQTQPVNPPGTYTVQAISSTNPSGLNFGNFQLVNISGEVYNDLNDNGHLDPGEPGLQGWTVLLLDPAGNTVATTTSDANGNYQFDNLFPGTFTIEEIVQQGWTQTQPVNPNYYTVTTQSGTNDTGLNFGNFFNKETLSGQVYNDLNGSGSFVAGDPPLAGWTITLYNSSGTQVAQTTSAADGSYSFVAVTPQDYTVVETVMPGWVCTQPGASATYTVPKTGGTVNHLDYGNFQTVSVSGNVYNDLNGNGQQDPGEPGLKGWTVEVVNSGGTVVASAVTNGSGKYTITGVGPGSFTLEEVLMSGWVITQPTNPSYYSFTTSSGSNVTGGVFGDYHAISVSGNVYNDQDGNGLRNGSEPGLANWTVNLEDSSGNIIATVLSDASGNYSFTGVGPGSYQVAEVVQTDYVQTQPLYPTVYSFTGQSGHNLTALNFGDHYAPALNPTQVIDNGQAGYSETGTWSTVVGGFNGTNRVARTVHSGSATATATWDFTGLGNTEVDVWVTFAGKSGYSKAAPFTIYNNGTSLGTQSINESILVTQNQGGRNQGSYGAVGWLELGTFTISSGDLKVVLDNLASGNYVDADGVLIIAHGGGSPVFKGPSPAAEITAIGTLGGPVQAPKTTVTISGVSAPAAVNVVYNNAPAAANQGTPTSVDAILGLGLSSQSSSSDVVTSLAQDLLTGSKKKS